MTIMIIFIMMLSRNDSKVKNINMLMKGKRGFSSRTIRIYREGVLIFQFQLGLKIMMESRNNQ
jgi:hypothetical protein